MVATGLRLGLLPGVVGGALGLVAAAGASRMLESQLYAVDPLDPRVYLLMAGVALAIGLLPGKGPFT